MQCDVLHNIFLYHNVQYCTVLHCTVMYNILQHCTALYIAVLYFITKCSNTQYIIMWIKWLKYHPSGGGVVCDNVTQCDTM